jgi:hypothetical protein
MSLEIIIRFYAEKALFQVCSPPADSPQTLKHEAWGMERGAWGSSLNDKKIRFWYKSPALKFRKQSHCGIDTN